MSGKVDMSDSEDSDEFAKSTDIRCTYCYKLLINVSQVPEHEKNCEVALNCTSRKVICKDGSEKFICDICCRTYKYANSLIEHEKRHKPPGGFQCKYCKRRFCTEVQLEQHTEETHKVYKCQVCKETFDKAEIYVDHIKKVHDGQDKLYHMCEECGRQFSSLHILKFHIDTKCGTLRLYKCDKCEKTFKTKYLLKAHDLLHVEGKQYCCSFCGNKFSTKAALQRHERRHTGEKPFKCEICGKTFAYGESLVTHSSVHTGIKPYLCECCGSRFSCTGNLLAHRRKRLETCGQPQYCTKLAKACPRPSIKTNEPSKSLIIKAHKVLKEDEVKRLKKQKSRKCRKKIKIEKCNKKSKVKDELPPEVIREIFEAEIPITQEDLYMAPVIKLEDNDMNDAITLKKDIDSKNDLLQYQLNTELTLKDDSDEYQKSENDVMTNNLEDAETELVTSSMITRSTIINSNKLLDEKIESDDNNENKNEENLVCQICNKTYKFLKSFKSHLRIHDGIVNVEIDSVIINQDVKPESNDDNSENYTKEKREESGNLFNTESDGKDVKPIQKFECSECLNETFSNKITFTRHLREIHKKQSTEICKILDKKINSNVTSDLQCTYCGKIYTFMKTLQKHLKLHGPDGTLIHMCRCCHKYFASPADVQNHMNNFHKNDVTCTICNKTYKDAELLQAHKRYSHSDDANKPKKYTFICNKCGRTLSSRTALTNHELSDCGISPIHKCKICGKGLHSAGSLKSHMLIHSGQLEFKCRYCEKGFARKGQCQIHERKHTGEKPFPCSYCDKAFAYRENLLIHISTHTGLKRYLCSSCGERFSCVTGLKAHWRTHATTCGSDPKRSTKATGIYLGFQKGQLVHTKEPTETSE